MTTRIAMWSGPRNISTAMMRAWENRSDTCVIDEPFYAYYLAQTQLNHPAADAVLEVQPNHWQDVVEQLLEAKNEAVFYQKHMTHHMLAGVDLNWCKKLRHCFLIRDPLAVVISYLKKMPSVSSNDIGIVRQYHLYHHLCQLTGQQIPIIDGDDVLANPITMLSKLCSTLELPFSEKMLHWPKGRRDSDGVWAQHWYKNVENSTGFKMNSPPIKGEYEAKLLATLTEEQREIVKINRVFYQELYLQRLIADT